MAGSTDRVSIYREMLKFDPGSRIFVPLAEELCAAGRWEEAAKVCEEGLRHRPDSLRGRALLGSALMEMGEAEESERVLLEIGREFQRHSFVFKLLSEFALLSGDQARAEELSGIYKALLGGQRMPETPVAAAPDPGEKIPQAPEPGPVPAQPEPEPEEAVFSPSARLEKILSALTDRISSRFAAPDAPSSPFSETDRDLLRQTIMAGLMG